MAEAIGRHDAGDAYDAVVLAGGAARRFGGVDKAMLEIEGATLLDRVLDACTGARTTTVVGPRRPTARADVRWARESPPGGGPVAALGAGVGGLDTPERAALTLVFAADLAFVDIKTTQRLLAAACGSPGGRTACRLAGHEPDGALLVDASGRDQPLAAVYRTASLTAALDRSRDEAGRLDGVPMRAVVGRLAVVRLSDTFGDSFDCDTWDALFTARSRAREDGLRG